MLRSSPDADAEIIAPPADLRRKLGARFGGVDPAAAIAKAEAALKGLSGNFDVWVSDEVEKLTAARAAVGGPDTLPGALDRIYLHAHDLKGLGATYGFPLISRVSASLCKLMDDAERRPAAPLPVIDAHIEAIRAIVRHQIRDPDHPTGVALVEALEARGTAHKAAAKGSSTAP